MVVDEINEASRAARALGYRSKVVTLDGQVINAGGSFTGGSVQRSAGIFTRKQEMEELRGKAAVLQKDCLAAQEKTDQMKEQVDALEAELTATASEQITAGNDRVRAEAEEKRLQATLEQAEAALTARNAEREALSARRAESLQKAAAAAAEEAALNEQIDAKTAELDRLAEGDDAFLTRQRALTEQVSAKRLEQVSRQKDAELAQSQIAALEQRAQDAAARRESLDAQLEALAQRSEDCRAEMEAIRKAKTDSAGVIAAKEAAIREATQQRLGRQQAETEALAKSRAAAENREELGREMARLAERKAAAEAEYDQTAAKLWDEYQLTVSGAEEVCVEFESLPALRAQVAELRNKIRALGNVNVSAIEEYKEVKARYDALSAQVADVEGSKNELTRMIANLCSQMREIFSDSFRAINENFRPGLHRAVRRGRSEFDFGRRERCACQRHRHPGGPAGQGHQKPGGPLGRRAGAGGHQHLLCHSGRQPRALLHPGRDRGRAGRRPTSPALRSICARVSDHTQFIVITHRRGTMEAANVLYGVTMQEDGVSKLLKLDLEQVDATLVS